MAFGRIVVSCRCPLCVLLKLSIRNYILGSCFLSLVFVADRVKGVTGVAFLLGTGLPSRKSTGCEGPGRWALCGLHEDRVVGAVLGSAAPCAGEAAALPFLDVSLSIVSTF